MYALSTLLKAELKELRTVLSALQRNVASLQAELDSLVTKREGLQQQDTAQATRIMAQIVANGTGRHGEDDVTASDVAARALAMGDAAGLLVAAAAAAACFADEDSGNDADEDDDSDFDIRSFGDCRSSDGDADDMDTLMHEGSHDGGAPTPLPSAQVAPPPTPIPPRVAIRCSLCHTDSSAASALASPTSSPRLGSGNEPNVLFSCGAPQPQQAGSPHGTQVTRSEAEYGCLFAAYLLSPS